jgi:hypothetical protein
MSGAFGKSGWRWWVELQVRLTTPVIRYPTSACLSIDAPSRPEVAVHRIDYPPSPIRYPLLSYNSLFQANPSRPIRELAAAGPQLPAV